jgi:hypothetical protein
MAKRPFSEMTISRAIDRLGDLASADDPIFLEGYPDETTPSKAYREGSHDGSVQGDKPANSLRILFFGVAGRGDREKSCHLLRGTLFDMVQERRGRKHDALPTQHPRRVGLREAAADLTKAVEVLRKPKPNTLTHVQQQRAGALGECAKEVQHVRHKVVTVGPPAPGLSHGYYRLAQAALEQAEVYLAMAGEAMKFHVKFADGLEYDVTPGAVNGVPSVVTLGQVNGAPPLEFVAWGSHFRVYGPEVPNITVIEESAPVPADEYHYTVITEVQDGMVLRPVATCFNKFWPKTLGQAIGIMPELTVRTMHDAALIVATNLRTGATRILKNRFGDQGCVHKESCGRVKA